MPHFAASSAIGSAGNRAGGFDGGTGLDTPIRTRHPGTAHTTRAGSDIDGALRRLPDRWPPSPTPAQATGELQRRATGDILRTVTSYSIAMTERVLMIEDDVSLASMVGEYLHSAGMHVDAAYDAASGLAALARERPDAVILDVMLPDMDGFEVCRRIRATSDVPIVMLTARGDDADRIVGLELGADDYLPKPFNPRELLARLRAVLRRSTGQWSSDRNVMQFGRLQIDPGSRSVTLGDTPCMLTGYQFDVLLALASNAGRVMSRERLMDHLRGETLEAFDRSIDVHVSRIRAAIEDDPHHPRRIITVRGAGYVFASEQD